MFEALKIKGRVAVAQQSAVLRDRIAAVDLDQARRWLPLSALLVIAGCSWFNDNSVPGPEANPAENPPAAQNQAPEPGEGEAMQSGTQTAQAGEATYPDINSVPTEAPQPSIVNLDQTQQGLGSDTANAQYTDTLTMPNESAARPEAPAPETGQVASVEPTAPETPPAEPMVAPEAATPAPEAMPETAPAATAEAMPATTPTTTPTVTSGATAGITPPPDPSLPIMPEIPGPSTAGSETAPSVAPLTTMPSTTMPSPSPSTSPQVAMAGTPQPGSKPFEPSGPLSLAPGSLTQNPQMAEAPTMPAGTSGISATPMPAGAPVTGDAVSVDYSVLNSLQAGGYQQSAPAQSAAPRTTATSAHVAGVGQAVGYVYFGNNSAHLTAADRQVLQQVVQLQRIQGGVLRIIGHASQRTGNMDALQQQQVNRQVSLERATAVAQALVGMGVQPLLVQVAAAGDSQTLYAESTPAGEAGNRRAEVYLSAN